MTNVVVRSSLTPTYQLLGCANPRPSMMPRARSFNPPVPPPTFKHRLSETLDLSIDGAVRAPPAAKSLQQPLDRPVKKDPSAVAGVPPLALQTWYSDTGSDKMAGLTLRTACAPQRLPGSAARVSVLPEGLIVHAAEPIEVPQSLGNFFRDHGLSPYATLLKFNVKTGKIDRVNYLGRQTALRDGWYAFVIDQSNRLVVGIAAGQQDAPNGAHANLVGGMPVRFAGALYAKDGVLQKYTNNSGTYRTPAYFAPYAALHPQLFNVTAELLGA
jgi:hypothetical protein